MNRKRILHNVTDAMDLYNSENTIVNLNNSVYNVFQSHQRHELDPGLEVELGTQKTNYFKHEIFDQITEALHSNNMTPTLNGTNSSDSDGQYDQLYSTLFNWRGVLLMAFFCTFIVITIIGNTLVILAVLTTRRLRTVTNCFVMSLAVADLLVGIFVMPPAVAVHFLGSWPLGWILCDIWISLDVLLCTASILSLCAISVDRYLAVTQPLTYSRKRRSKRLALIMILIVWVLALAITCPPILGWYEPGRRDLKECRYNQNEGYVIFSAMGSFFIPMAVMIYVYARISCVVASRHDNMTDIGVHNKKLKRLTTTETDCELDHYMSEQEPSPSQRKQMASRSLSNQTFTDDMIIDDTSLLRQNHHRNNNNTSGNYELMMGSSRTPSFKRQPSFISANRNTSTSLMSGISAQPSNSTVVEQQWTYGGHQRHQSVRHQCVSVSSNQYASDTYITRNTRIIHQNQQASKSLANRLTILKKENKTTQTLSIVVGGFIACWLPFFIDYLITPFLTEPSKALAEFLTWLGWFNSAINPFIYAFYSVDFRTAFWRLTFKRFCRDSSKQQFPSNTMSIRR